jgi:hypothetical protein
MDSSLIDPGTPPGAVATSFAKQALINASVMAKGLRFPQEPLQTLRLCAFAPLRETRPLGPVSRKGAKLAKILLKAAQFLSGGRNYDLAPKMQRKYKEAKCIKTQSR